MESSEKRRDTAQKAYEHHKAQGLGLQQKKEFAKVLYVRERLTQKELAIRVGIGEHAIGRWIKDGGWETLRRNLLVTKQEQIGMLYGQLETLSHLIAQREEKVANSKEADIYTKLTAAIRNLETEINIGDCVEIGMEFCDYVRNNAPEKIGEIVDLFDAYIKTRMNR